jgi:hypothetical protein
MSFKTLLTRSLVASVTTAVLVLAAPVSATPLTNTTWLVGSGEVLTVHRSANAQTVPVGGFQGDFGANHIEFWCFDLDHTFSLGTTYDYIATAFTGALATRVAQLFEAGGSGGSDADHAAGFQLALWNVLYDSDTTVSGNTGFYVSGSSNAVNDANAYLADMANHTGSSVTLARLTSTSRDPQHQGFITPNTVPLTLVPEPPAMPLVLTALAVLGLVETRRRMRARGG